MSQNIRFDYNVGLIPEVEQIIELYESSGIKRPTFDPERIQKMYTQSNLIVSAWYHGNLVGVSRSLTDFSYSCYLSDLAVHKKYQTYGIGKKLIELTREQIGEKVALILISAPGAMGYYPKIGFEKVENGFIIKRLK